MSTEGLSSTGLSGMRKRTPDKPSSLGGPREEAPVTQEGPVGKINWSRVVRGGLLWAAVYGTLAAPLMYLFLAREFIEGLEAIGRPLQLSPSLIAFLVPFGLVFTVTWGILAVWLYAAIRPRYGPGPKSAVAAAVAVWLLSVVAPLSHLAAFGVASGPFVAIDLAAELVLILSATLVGARQYKD